MGIGPKYLKISQIIAALGSTFILMGCGVKLHNPVASSISSSSGSGSSSSIDTSSYTSYNAAGSGTGGDPYLIYTNSQLSDLASNSSDTTAMAASYRLEEDLDLDGVTQFQIGNCGAGTISDGDEEAFIGTFDGNNKTISNYTYSTTDDCVGLFGMTEGATIQDLTLSDVDVDGDQYTGGLIGIDISSGTTTLSNITVSGTIDSTSSSAGGIAGYVVGATLSSLTSTATVSSASYAGGVIGYLGNSTVSQCSYSGTVSTTGGYIGGAFGFATISRIENCSSAGTVNPSGSYGGGLIGYTSSAVVYSSYSTANVSGAGNIGGLVGRGSRTFIFASYASSSTVSGTGTYFGGLAGYLSSGLIANSYSDVTLSTNNQYIGGLVGRTSVVLILNSYSKGSVTGTTTSADNVGGVVGYTHNTIIKNVYSEGAVSGDNNVGGVLGNVLSNTELENCFALGDVTAGNANGYKIAPSSATNCYSYSGSTCTDSGTCDSSQEAGNHAALSDFYDSTNAPLSSWDFLAGAGDGSEDIWEESGSDYPELYFVNETSYTDPFSGSGTSSDPYLISSVSDFQKIGANTRYFGSYFRLTSNLDFTAQTLNPIASVRSFDGDEFTISNVTLNDNLPTFGILRSVAWGAEVKDLNLSAASIDAGWGGTVGTVVGHISGTLSNVHATNGDVTTTNSEVGGLIGYAHGATIQDASSSADVDGLSDVGGIVGVLLAGTASQVRFSGTVAAGADGGGIAGVLSGIDASISNCYNTGDVTMGAGGTGGGIVGGIESTSNTISRCYSSGAISGDTFLGGIAGDAEGTIEYSFATGDVTTTAAGSAGLIYGTTTFTPTLTETYVLNTATCGGPSTCNSTYTGTKTAAQLYDSTEAPFSAATGNWDTSIWTFGGAAYPTQ